MSERASAAFKELSNRDASCLASAVFEELSKRYEPKCLYKGDCRGCGECCSRFLPVSDREIEALRAYVEFNAVSPRPDMADIDLTCPFLDEDRTCSVYAARPAICRAYRCDRSPDGYSAERLDVSSMHVVDMREVFPSRRVPEPCQSGELRIGRNDERNAR